MNKVTLGYNDIVPFTEDKACPMHLRGYGFRVKRRVGNGQAVEFDIFSNRSPSRMWVKMVPNSSGGYTLGGTYCNKNYLLRQVRTCVAQIENHITAVSSMSKTTLIDQAIVFSETKGVSQMFKSGTTLDEVVAVLEKRSIEIDSSFKVFYPKTGLVKNLVAVPQKVVLRFE